MEQDNNKPIEEMSAEELNKMKIWLFKENVRVQNEKKELDEYGEKLLQERSQFRDEIDILSHKIVSEKKRLKEDKMFFDKKMEILVNGFKRLEADTAMFEKEKKRFEAEKKYYMKEKTAMNADSVNILFRGINGPLTLKKRYRELLKIFHPDNLSGDMDMVQLLTKEYEKLKREFENKKK
jgi:hypothetical protein